MSAGSSHMGRGTFRSLWARAALWRFSLLSACLLTLLFLLFPPEKQAAAPERFQPPLEQAAYLPQSTIAAKAPPKTTPSGGDSVVAAPSISPRAPVLSDSGARIAATKPQKAVNAPSPRPAQIALATSAGGSASQDVSGVDAALMGRTYSDSISLYGYNLPLPAGRWAMLSNSTVNTPTASGMAYFLGRIEHKRLVGALRAVAVKSKEDPGTGFPAMVGCKESEANNIYVQVDSATPFDHQACWWIQNYYTPPWQQWADRAVKISNIDRAAAGDMAAKGVTYPQDFVVVRFSRAEKWGLLEVSYLFNPEVEGISSRNAASFRDADWHAGNIARYPDKVAYINKLKAWGTSFWPKFKTSFDGAAPVVSPASTSALQKIERAESPAVNGVNTDFRPLDIKIGDSVAAVKAVLKTDLAPKMMERNPALPPNVPDMNAGKSVLHLATKGIWVFFDQVGKVYTIRLDAPFAGDVKGIRLGDDLAKLTSTLGNPLTNPYPAFGRMLAYKYVLDDVRHVIYDLGDAKVQYIFITN